jgi:hypothetical protein
MTRTVVRKTYALRVIARVFGVLTVFVALVVLAQAKGAGQVAGKRPAAQASPNTSASLPAPKGPQLVDRGSPGRVFVGRDASSIDTVLPMFLPAVTYVLDGFFARSVAAGDINGDGKADLLVASLCTNHFCNTVGSVDVFLGNGDGTFRKVGDYGSAGIDVHSVAIADLNGDGKPDMVVTSCQFKNCRLGAVTIRTGNGDGTFAGGTYVFDSGGEGPNSVAVADVNGDGKLDLLVANSCDAGCDVATGVVGILLGNGDATFQPAASYSSGGIHAESVAVADVNGDGKPDLVIANECATSANCPVSVDGSVSVLLGNGNGTFQTAVAYDAGGIDSTSVGVADVNGDGKVDLVVTNSLSNAVAVLLGNGNGTFQNPIAYVDGTPRSIVVADVNQDGKRDLAVANGLGVGVLLGNGDGTFQTATDTSGGGQGALAVAVADVNGDGLPDAMVVNNCFNNNPNCPHGSIGVLLNNTGPHSPTTTALVSNVNPAAVNQQVTYTATVTNQSGGPITGTVMFKHGATTIVRLVGGQASYSTPYTKTGRHAIIAVYSGDTANESSTSPTLIEYIGLAPTTTVVSTSGSPSHLGQLVTFTATVTWTYGTVPNGEPVSFFDGTTAIGTGTTASGVAKFSTSSLNAKTHTIKAKYPGDGMFKLSSGAVTQVVQP